MLRTLYFLLLNIFAKLVYMVFFFYEREYACRQNILPNKVVCYFLAKDTNDITTTCIFLCILNNAKLISGFFFLVTLRCSAARSIAKTYMYVDMLLCYTKFNDLAQVYNKILTLQKKNPLVLASKCILFVFCMPRKFAVY